MPARLICLVNCTDERSRFCGYEICELDEPYVWLRTNLGSGDRQGPMSCVGDKHHTLVPGRDEIYTHALFAIEGGTIGYFGSEQECHDFIVKMMRRQNVEVLYA